MTPDEERELLNRLLDLVEVLWLQKIVLTAALDVFTDRDWRRDVDDLKNAHRATVAAKLQPFRDVVLGNPVGILQESAWQDVVRKLIESVGENDPQSE